MRWFWNSYALIYDSVRHLLPYHELLQKTLKALHLEKGNIRILDAGCGTGNFAILLTACWPYGGVALECIDASRAMIRRAKKKSRHLPWAHYYQGNLNQSLPYPEGHFDSIVCINTLYATENPKAVLQEFWRVLKFGGRLVLANPKTNPRIRDIFLTHVRMATRADDRESLTIIIKTIVHLPLWLAGSLFNMVIRRQAAKKIYHFFEAPTLTSLVELGGFRKLNASTAYGGTVVLITATKVLKMKDKTGEHLSLEAACTPEDLTAIHRLRFQAYCQEFPMLDPGQYPGAEERDQFDPYSIQLLARSRKEVVGTLRLIKDSPLGFLMEQSFRLPPLDRSKALEHSRGVVRKDYRGRDIHTLLTEAAYVWHRHHGFTICLGAATEIVKSSLCRKGWKMIGEPLEYHNTIATPIMLCLNEEK